MMPTRESHKRYISLPFCLAIALLGACEDGDGNSNGPGGGSQGNSDASIASGSALIPGADSDRDGVLDELEGEVDLDGDGEPAYLDADETSDNSELLAGGGTSGVGTGSSTGTSSGSTGVGNTGSQGEACGDVTCGAGEQCCDADCGICGRDGICPAIACEKGDAGGGTTGNGTGGTPVDPCAVVDCAEDFVCVAVQVQCFAPPCNPVAECQEVCGDTTCRDSEYCCNPLSSVCAPKGDGICAF